MESPHQRALSVLQFKLRAYQSDGQAFEDLFSAVMGARFPRFRQIKPQGQLGDRKNDGFDPTTGTYYQVFAPESVWKGDKYGAEKVADDLKGLLQFWNDASQIRVFRYVVNDKFKGIGPEIERTLRDLRTKHTELSEVSSFLAKELMNEFLLLDPEQRSLVLGNGLPVSMEAPEGSVEAVVLTEVIHYILTDNGDLPELKVPVSPSFEQKLKFNFLGEPFASQLRAKNPEAITTLQAYYRHRDPSEKDVLAQRFKSYFQTAEMLFAAESDRTEAAGLVFLHIADHVTLKKTRAYRNAALLLMSYFFETCDIFHEPPTAS